MGRQTTVVYAHLVRWEPLKLESSHGRAWIKTLNIDPDTGARSALIRYDPGFTMEATVSHWPTDVLVLEGGMQCGDLEYGPRTYHYRPAGAATGPISTDTGITRLVLSGTETGKPPAAEDVFHFDINTLPYQRSYTHPTDPDKGAVKMLREDEGEGVSVLLSSAFAPGTVLPGVCEMHDHFEEAFHLEGQFEDYLGFVDGHMVWVPGSTYVYRQPFTSEHGDVIKYTMPQAVFVRRGWTGEVETFHQNAWAPDKKRVLGAITYQE